MLAPDLKKNEYKYILVALLLVLGVIIFIQMRPYLGGFLGALTLYVILRRQMKYLVEKKGWSRGLSAILILIEALFFFLIPLTGIATLIIDRLSGINIDLANIKNSVVEFFNGVEDRFGIDFFTFDNLSFLPQLGTNIVQIVASNSYSFLINLLIIVFVLYFMLFSYREFEQIIREILPFSDKNKTAFIGETQSIIKANAIGIPLLALVQGSFAYVGYLIFGVSSPAMYAIITAFATILPIIGTAIVYVPLCIGLVFAEKYGAAIGLLLYGIFIIGSVDNVARFILQKKLADIHPLITVFGVLIGLPMFGFWGVVFGPLVLSLFVLFFNMYRYDYIENSTARPYVSVDNRNAESERETPVKLSFFKKKKQQKQHEDIDDDNSL